MLRNTRQIQYSVLALVGAICLVGAAVTVAQRVEQPQPPAVHSPQDLSAVFRNVARQATPSVVVIETTGKEVEVQTRGLPFGENSPFRDFFENDPRFREFFEEGPRRLPRPRGMGSGFIIDGSGIIMTNAHVLRGAEEVKVRLHDGREFLAQEWKTDPRTDVAILRIEAQGLEAIRLGKSEEAQVGDWVVAIGSPFGLELSVTQGIISAMGRGPGIADREDFIQTDAAINPGNSGGPLLNLKGEVIGINTAISSRSGGYDGIGFAIPIDMARWVGDQLVKEGVVKRAYLGVTIQPVTDEFAKQFNVDVNQGALVRQVIPDSPAERAKLEPRDVIVKLNGVEIDGPHALQETVEKLTLGETYPLTVIRDGEEITLKIKAEEMPGDYSLARLGGGRSPQPEAEESKFDKLGIRVEKLSPAVAQQLGLQEGGGVLVAAVDPGGLAAQAGLQPGDVVEKVGTDRVGSLEEYRAALDKFDLADGIVLNVHNASGKRFVVIRQD